MNFMSATEQRQFVDTNILIYAHDSSAGVKHDKAKALLNELWRSGDGCLSVQVFQEFYVNVTRKLPIPLAPELAIEIITDLSAWPVHSPKTSDLIDAIGLQTRRQISFWDAMILTSARQLGCQTLWSEDLNTGQKYEGIEVRNPFA
jgi:predicted nucleic acid-binding protein